MLHNSEKQATSLQKVFTFNGTIDVQVVMVNGEPHFVVADVCHVLTLTNTTKATYGLDDDEYLTLPVVRAGQQRAVNVVNESGLYALIFQSRKPIAKQFRRWVTGEVLPAIRKTGVYAAPKASKELEALKESLAQAEQKASMWRQISEINERVSLRSEEFSREMSEYSSELFRSYISMKDKYRAIVNEWTDKLVKEYHLKP